MPHLPRPRDDDDAIGDSLSHPLGPTVWQAQIN